MTRGGVFAENTRALRCGVSTFAGASATVSFQWRVSDAATARFMIEFYGHFAWGDSKKAALRAARFTVLALGAYPLARR